MTTTPMNLRLAMAAWSVTHDEDEPWEDAPAIEKYPYMLELDAILREMLEPSEGMRAIAEEAWNEEKPPIYILRAVIQHIIDETQD